MKAEQLALALRPRAPLEAADLGTRMTQAAWPVLRRAWLPAALVLVLACGATVELAEWLPGTLLWWLKPLLDRGLLAVYARQAFGESSTWADVWAAHRAAPLGPLLRSLTWTRLSPWRSLVLPVGQLEGQHGKARRKRLQVLMSGQRGSALAVQSACSLIEMSLAAAAFMLPVMLVPELGARDLLNAMTEGDHPLLASLAGYALYAGIVLLLEPLYVAAGFAMYLNRRVELEAWDTEQDLRRAFGGEGQA